MASVNDRRDCLVIRAKEWFKRDDFLDWLEGQRELQNQPPATWHVPNGQANETSDAFIYFEKDRPGSDSMALPDDINEEIRELADEENFEAGIIWIQPIPGDDHDVTDDV